MNAKFCSEIQMYAAQISKQQNLVWHQNTNDAEIQKHRQSSEFSLEFEMWKSRHWKGRNKTKQGEVGGSNGRVNLVVNAFSGALDHGGINGTHIT